MKEYIRVFYCSQTSIFSKGYSGMQPQTEVFLLSPFMYCAEWNAVSAAVILGRRRNYSGILRLIIPIHALAKVWGRGKKNATVQNPEAG